MSSVVDAIISLIPDAKFELAGDDYADIVWADERTQPTEAQVTAEIARLEQDFVDKEYQRDREIAYPSIQEQLDMQYWDAVNGTTTWKDAIAQVKADYPKP